MLNLIVIVCDAWRRDFVGAYGATEVATPNLDRFAGEAVVFDHAYAGSFPTLPCRGDLFTGKFVFPYLTWGPLPAGEVVLAEWLSDHRYHTALVVDNLPVGRRRYGYDRGFQSRIQIRGQWYDDWAPPGTPVRWPAPKEKFGQPHRVEQYLRNVAGRRGYEDYFAPRVAEAAIRWLETFGRRGPFYLHIEGFDPHEPWDPPEECLVEAIPDEHRILYPILGRADRYAPDELAAIRALYRGEVRMADEAVGRILAAIDALGLRENSAVVFMSDHGIFLGEHNLLGKSSPRREDVNGWPPYVEAARIPLMMRIPGVAPRRVDALVQPGDLMPTLLELAGVPPPPTLRGTASLLPLARGAGVPIRSVAVTSWSYRGWRTTHPSVIRTHDWSLVWWRSGIRPELYDRRADPNETQDLFETHREVARELHARFVEFLKPQPHPFHNYWSRRFFWAGTGARRPRASVPLAGERPRSGTQA